MIQSNQNNGNKMMNKRKIRGFTILEVLIAIVLLSLGFLSMVALQGSAMKYSQTAYFRGIASQIGNGLAASIRANPKGVSDYKNTASYNPAPVIPSLGCTASDTCTPTEVANSDIAWARRSANMQLPGGDVWIDNGKDSDGVTFVDIVLVWQDPQTKDGINLPCPATVNVSAAENPQCLPMRVRL